MSILSAAQLSSEVLVGNDAGWHLSFHPRSKEGVFPDDDQITLEFGADDYYADIRAALPGELTGGSYTFVIEGLIDDHYQKIARKPENATSAEFVKLYLYWRDATNDLGTMLADASGLGALASMIPNSKAKKLQDQGALVAVLRVDAVTRRAGRRRYETTITANEVIWAFLSSRIPAVNANAPKSDSFFEKLFQSLKWKAGKQYKLYDLKPNPDSPPDAPAKEAVEEFIGDGRMSFLPLLQQWQTHTALALNTHGRGLLLIREGVLHIGPRPIPLDGKAKPLDTAGGLVESLVDPPANSDRSFDYIADPTGAKGPKARRQFHLTLKGRPDLKPGDVVQFASSPEDVSNTSGGIAGALGDALQAIATSVVPSLSGGDMNVKMYVASVEHRLARTSGFVTTLTGVELADKDSGWDPLTPSDHPAPKNRQSHANPETEASHAIKGLAEQVLGGRAAADVGEVRRINTDPNAKEPPQTLRLWRGLKPSGTPYQSRQCEIVRPGLDVLQAAPYLTPFAWGRCGMVLPRFPGVRVFILHRNGQRNDPVDAGAIWPSNEGPVSKVGDFWLILPAYASETDVPTEANDDAKTAPDAYTGPVTHDLIDATGGRVIEVGKLTLRVRNRGSLTSASDLSDASKRPQGGDDGTITIEHGDSHAKITIDQDGKITLSGKNIEINADEDVNINAAKVNVKVSETMDVSKG